MSDAVEERMFENYLASENLKHSRQRSDILHIFLNIDRHVTAEELYRVVRRRYPGIGYATVYRTLKLLADCGLCRELKFDRGAARYEHLYDHKHHDHLICTKCGVMVEIIEPGIEDMQTKIFARYGFHPERHKMELYGVCRKCRKGG